MRIIVAAIVFFCCLAVALFINWGFRMDLGDDAYIGLRIADNLVKTGHAYFNHSERVMVTSSPVWILFLAANELVFGKTNLLWLWNSLFSSLAATVAYLLFWGPINDRSAARNLLAILLPLTVLAILADSSILGMETPLAMALLLMAALAFVEDSAAFLPLLALAAFIRYELGPLLVVAGGVCLLTGRARKYGAAAAACIAAALTGILFSQYGTIIPNTIKAKSKGFVLPRWFTWGALLPQQPPLLRPFINFFLIVAFAGLAVITWETLKDRERAPRARLAGLFLIFWGCALGALYLLAKAFMFIWYLPLVWVPILAGALLVALTEKSLWRLSISAFVVISIFITVYAHFGLLIHSLAVGHTEKISLVSESARTHEYLAVGDALRQTCPASDLMTSEIGALSYAFQGHVLDGFGLASPDAIKYHPMRVPEERAAPWLGAIPTGYVREKKPDLIVTFDIFGAAVLRSRDILAEYDDLVYAPVIPSDRVAGIGAPWGIKALHVLVKKGGACPLTPVQQKLSSLLQAQL